MVDVLLMEKQFVVTLLSREPLLSSCWLELDDRVRQAEGASVWFLLLVILLKELCLPLLLTILEFLLGFLV